MTFEFFEKKNIGYDMHNPIKHAKQSNNNEHISRNSKG